MSHQDLLAKVRALRDTVDFLINQRLGVDEHELLDRLDAILSAHPPVVEADQSSTPFAETGGYAPVPVVKAVVEGQPSPFNDAEIDDTHFGMPPAVTPPMLMPHAWGCQCPDCYRNFYQQPSLEVQHNADYRIEAAPMSDEDIIAAARLFPWCR